MFINFSSVATLVLMIITFSFLGPTNVKGSEREYFSFIDLTKFDSLQILNWKMQPGDTLSKILLSYDVSYNVINEVERIAKPTFDLRKFRTGNNYFIINGSNSINKIQYFISVVSG